MRNILFAIVLSATACAARPSHTTLTPEASNDMLARYLQGESLDNLAADMRMNDRDDARDAVHRAMIALQKRYYQDR
jgi:hypothetical protein